MGFLLEVNDIKKYFKVPSGLLHAVDGVTFKIEAQKTLGLVGESGCGKSTLGRVILHLIEPTSGQIIYDGEDITKVTGRRKKELCQSMQIIFQDPFSSLNPRMTVLQSIEEPIRSCHTIWGNEKIHKRAHELMDLVGLASGLAQSYPHELDGGRRQRIGIARALSLNPNFIVCDEPVSALDVSMQAQILNLLQDLQKDIGLTYLFITHNLSVIKHISDDILVMYLGKIVEKCSSKELFKNARHPYTKALISAIPVPNVNNRPHRILLKGELASPINPKVGCRFAPRCSYATAECFECDPEFNAIGPDHIVACHHCRLM